MRNASFIFILIVIMFSTQFVRGQNLFQQMKLEQWNTKKGMPNDLILNVYQAKDGFIYMTGYSGLIRFDGVSFTSFTSRNTTELKSDNIESLITETEDSTLWIPTAGSGLLAFKNGRFTTHLQGVKHLSLVGKTKKEELLLNIHRGSLQFMLFDTRTHTYKNISATERIALHQKGLMNTANRTDKDGTIKN
jgi:ligand-binding sensor domain-containing protein